MFFANYLYGNTKLEKIGNTEESNTLQVDLSTLSTGVYELYASTGEYCLLGYNDNWIIVFKTHNDTMLKDENTLQMLAGSWYSNVYRRKIL